MKFLCRIIKYQHIAIPCLVLSLAVNAASLIEKDKDLLEEYGQARINRLVNSNFLVESKRIWPIAQKKKNDSSNTPLDINETKIENKIEAESLQEDKKNLITNLAPPLPADNIALSEITTNAEKSGPQLSVSKKKLSGDLNFDKFNQKTIIENSRQLKLLAYDLFGDETLEDLFVTQQEVKNLFYQADAWIKEVLFDDSQWRLEDSIYGSAAILFINDSSLIKFLRKFDDNAQDFKKMATNFETNANYSDIKSKDFESDSALLKSYFSILDFIGHYGGSIIYTLLSIVIIREVINLIAKALKSKNKSSKKSKRRIRSRSIPKKTDNLDSPHSELAKDNQVARASVNYKKSGSSSAKRRHRGRKNRPKRSMDRKILDNTNNK